MLGDWVGDLIIRGEQPSALGIAVERTSRLVLLLHLPDGREAVRGQEAMKTGISGLAEEPYRTITWE